MTEETVFEKICFIIATKYNRNYKSYLKFYVDNIQKFYKDSYILIIDNNSKYVNDIILLFQEYNNLKIIINNSDCKFEIGAYNEGIRYILNNNLLEKYDYYVFSQDNFVLKNKYDFNLLSNNNILACSFNHWDNFQYNSDNNYSDPTVITILNKLNIFDKLNEYNLAWCSSFIIHKSKILHYYDIVKDEILTTRADSCKSERYLSGILYYLNNYKYVSICGDIATPSILGYDCWNVDIENDNLTNYFIKRVQQKNEHTLDE
jgi:hypothetical protein